MGSMVGHRAVCIIIFSKLSAQAAELLTLPVKSFLRLVSC